MIGLRDIFYRNNEPLQVGDQFQNEPLATTLALIRDNKNAFHTLPLAEEIGWVSSPNLDKTNDPT